MRLIDADALDWAFTSLRWRDGELLHWGDRPNWCLVGEEVEKLIADAPAIDAIPVEWLNKQCEIADDRGDMEMTDAISWLIQTWQEEQEAQDGKA